MKKRMKLIILTAFIVLILLFAVARRKQAVEIKEFRETYKEAVFDTYNSYKEYLSNKSEDNYQTFVSNFAKLPELSNDMPESTVQNKRFHELNTMYSLLVDRNKNILKEQTLVEDILYKLYINIDDPDAYGKMFVLRNAD